MGVGEPAAVAPAGVGKEKATERTKTTPKSGHGPRKSVSTAVRGTMLRGWVKLGGWRVGVRVGLGGWSGCRVFGGVPATQSNSVTKVVPM